MADVTTESPDDIMDIYHEMSAIEENILTRILY